MTVTMKIHHLLDMLATFGVYCKATVIHGQVFLNNCFIKR